MNEHCRHLLVVVPNDYEGHGEGQDQVGPCIQLLLNSLSLNTPEANKHVIIAKHIHVVSWHIKLK